MSAYPSAGVTYPLASATQAYQGATVMPAENSYLNRLTESNSPGISFPMIASSYQAASAVPGMGYLDASYANNMGFVGPNGQVESCQTLNPIGSGANPTSMSPMIGTTACVQGTSPGLVAWKANRQTPVRSCFLAPQPNGSFGLNCQ